jgi:hypothetical protein
MLYHPCLHAVKPGSFERLKEFYASECCTEYEVDKKEPGVNSSDREANREKLCPYCKQLMDYDYNARSYYCVCCEKKGREAYNY